MESVSMRRGGSSKREKNSDLGLLRSDSCQVAMPEIRAVLPKKILEARI